MRQDKGLGRKGLGAVLLTRLWARGEPTSRCLGSALSYSSPLGRGIGAVLGGDEEGLHMRRDQRSWTHVTFARHEQKHSDRPTRGDPPPPAPSEPGTPP